MYGLHKRANTKQRKSMLKRINTLIKANTLESIFNKVLKKILRKYNLFRNLNVHIARVCFQGSTFLSCCWHYQIFRCFKCIRWLLCSFSHVVIIVLCILLAEEVKATRQHVVLVIILFLHTKCDFEWKTWKEIWINIVQICILCRGEFDEMLISHFVVVKLPGMLNRTDELINLTVFRRGGDSFSHKL